MIICKDFNTQQVINNIDDWKKLCPPEGGDKQWKDRRSAKELAKDWIKDRGNSIIKKINSSAEFANIKFIKASPEYESRFDNYRGKGRQHDLLVLGKDKKGLILISIEAKADEEFGKVIKDYYIKKIVDRINGINTKAPERIEGLIYNIFGTSNKAAVFNLRYQLLHAIAGILAEAKRLEINRAVFVINTYRSNDQKLFNIEKHKNNMKDLNNFIKCLSNGKIHKTENNRIVGPFKFKDSRYIIFGYFHT